MVISKEQEFVVIYTTTKGMYRTSNGRKTFGPSTDYYETKTITVVATDYYKARALAYTELQKTKYNNEYIKILKAIPIPEKKKKEEELCIK